MIIIGAKGMAKELLEILSSEMKMKDNEILFFDNISKDLPELLFKKFRILKDFKQVSEYFTKTSSKFVLGLGNPARIIKHHE